jgi:hypothetical protein
MHHWGDENVDWGGIGECCDYFHKMSRRYGRLGGQIKEKYGTVRFYATFGYLSLHTLLYPGYVSSQFPKWLWRADIYYIGPFLRFFFEKIFVKWQIFIYSRMYQTAIKKWPHLRKEILCAADHPELIKGVTKKVDNDLHILDKDGNILSTRTTI